MKKLSVLVAGAALSAIAVGATVKGGRLPVLLGADEPIAQSFCSLAASKRPTTPSAR